MISVRRRELEFRARRERIIARFVSGALVPEADIEDWMARWERHAEQAGVRRESAAYWGAGVRWIAGQREKPAMASEVA